MQFQTKSTHHSKPRTVLAVPSAATYVALAASLAAGGAAIPPVAAQTPLPAVVVEGATRSVRPAPRAQEVQEPVPQAAASPVPRNANRRPQAAASTGGSPNSQAASPAPDASRGDIPPGLLLGNQGTATTVITDNELQQQQVSSPVEALRGIPGVVVGRTGPFGGLAQVRIRGAEANHTLVVIDGIEVNNPADGEFDFSNIVGSDNIERIEVLRGVQSGLYGSGAMGGVINIVTKSGKGPLTLNSRVEYGSFNTKDAAVSLSAGGDKAWGLLSTQTRKTAGFNVAPFGNEKDANQTTSSVVKAGFSPIEGLTIEGVMRHTGKRGNRDEENFTIPGVLIEQTDALSRFSSNLWVGALESKLSLLGGAWVQSVRADRKSIVNDDLSANPAFAPFESYERYRASAETFRYTSTFRLDTPGVPQVRHFLTGLAEQKHENFIQYTNDAVDHERKIRSFAGEVRGEYWNSLFLTGSLRRDDTEQFGDYTTWRGAASLKVTGTPARLHGSYGTGVKLPSLFEQYGRTPLFFTPNPNLTPETSKGWDAGLELSFLNGRAVFDATWFDTDLKDKIRGVFSGGTSTSINLAGISTRQGLELSGKVIPLSGLTVGAAYTFLEAREPTGTAELRRPRNSGRIDATYAFDRDRAKVGVAAVYNGVMQDEALRTASSCFFGSCFPLTSERVALKDYWLVSAMASYKITPQLEMYGRVENLLDQRYQEVYGFGTPGLAVYGGVRMTLQDKSVPLAP